MKILLWYLLILTSLKLLGHLFQLGEGEYPRSVVVESAWLDVGGLVFKAGFLVWVCFLLF